MKSGIIAITIVVLFLIRESTTGGLADFMSVVKGSSQVNTSGTAAQSSQSTGAYNPNAPTLAGIQPLAPSGRSTPLTLPNLYALLGNK